LQKIIEGMKVKMDKTEAFLVKRNIKHAELYCEVISRRKEKVINYSRVGDCHKEFRK